MIRFKALMKKVFNVLLNCKDNRCSPEKLRHFSTGELF